jgi:spectinomycin phosphotransferase/16S rRNA (guanine(1405)-N(7))-methyltransferase
MLLRAHQHEVRSALGLYDRLARVTSASTESWCLTHGEPGGTNLVQDQRGAVFLVDWESARMAPPERDLAALYLSAGDLERYQALAGGWPVRQDIVRLYQLWYALAETAVYLLQFRRPHVDDANLRESWRNFQRFVPTQERWPELSK